MSEMTETERQDLQIAKDAYAIMRGAKGAKLFPHHWDGLPEHYHELLIFTVAHARQTPDAVKAGNGT